MRRLSHEEAGQAGQEDETDAQPGADAPRHPDQAAVPLWPHTGWALGVGRSLTYEGAESGVIPTIEGIGRRKPVPTSWLRPKVGLGEPST